MSPRKRGPGLAACTLLALALSPGRSDDRPPLRRLPVGPHRGRVASRGHGGSVRGPGRQRQGRRGEPGGPDPHPGLRDRPLLGEAVARGRRRPTARPGGRLRHPDGRGSRRAVGDRSLEPRVPGFVGVGGGPGRGGGASPSREARGLPGLEPAPPGRPADRGRRRGTGDRRLERGRRRRPLSRERRPARRPHRRKRARVAVAAHGRLLSARLRLVRAAEARSGGRRVHHRHPPADRDHGRLCLARGRPLEPSWPRATSFATARSSTPWSATSVRQPRPASVCPTSWSRGWAPSSRPRCGAAAAA